MKLALLLPLFAAPLLAGQRETLAGYFMPVAGEENQLLFSFGPDREPWAEIVSELDDPDALKRWPRARIEVERDVSTGRGIALRLQPSELLWPGGESLSPERWAGANTGLHPSLNENQPFEVTGPSDYDGDGVPDHLDVFPDDPTESDDNDNDGIGDNADPDDDNDGMSDTYEIANGLNPFVNDSHEDPDGDGFTNGEEAAAGTAARDGASLFRIQSVKRSPQGFVTLSWEAFPGRSYEIWHLPRLDFQGVRVAENLRVNNPGLFDFTVPAQAPRAFYFVRVIADPP